MLRDYQQEIYDKTIQAWDNGFKAPLIQLSTGSGKSHIFREIIKHFYDKKKSIFLLAHRNNLIEQASEHLMSVGVMHGIIAANYPTINYRTQVCSVQTLVRRYKKYNEPSLIITDECHHANASTYKKIFDHWPSSKLLGVTATPMRMDGKGLGDIYDHLIIGPQMKDLIDRGHLSNYAYYAPDNFDHKGVKTTAGDWNRSEVLKKVDKPKIIGSAIDSYTKYSAHKPAVAFCVSIEHAIHVCEEFNKHGYKAKVLHCKLKPQERQSAINDLANGSIEILTSCDMISEGTDIPKVTTAILLRPTKSLTIFLQQIGRILRPYEDKKEAIILDHVSNWLFHGMPDDHRDWNLTATKIKPDEYVSLLKRCPECFRPVKKSDRECPFCGVNFVFSSRPKEMPEEIAGKLTRVDLRNLIHLVANSKTLKEAFNIAGPAAEFIWKSHLKRS